MKLVWNEEGMSLCASPIDHQDRGIVRKENSWGTA